KSQQAIDALRARQKSEGIAAARIVVAGGSQGCAMTLQTGLRYPEKLAGLLCLSGYRPIHATVDAERHAANHDVPIFLAHGTSDPVVPFHRAEQSRDLLLAMGYQVEWHEYSMPHSVCAEEVDDIGAWLRRVLG
ncbi:MAG: alpha/beta hydrolase, partial [Burkholderiaceae bacterium]